MCWWGWIEGDKGSACGDIWVPFVIIWREDSLRTIFFLLTT